MAAAAVEESKLAVDISSSWEFDILCAKPEMFVPIQKLNNVLNQVQTELNNEQQQNQHEHEPPTIEIECFFGKPTLDGGFNNQLDPVSYETIMNLISTATQDDAETSTCDLDTIVDFIVNKKTHVERTRFSRTRRDKIIKRRLNTVNFQDENGKHESRVHLRGAQLRVNFKLEQPLSSVEHGCDAGAMKAASSLEDDDPLHDCDSVLLSVRKTFRQRCSDGVFSFTFGENWRDYSLLDVLQRQEDTPPFYTFEIEWEEVTLSRLNELTPKEKTNSLCRLLTLAYQCMHIPNVVAALIEHKLTNPNSEIAAVPNCIFEPCAF